MNFYRTLRTNSLLCWLTFPAFSQTYTDFREAAEWSAHEVQNTIDNISINEIRDLKKVTRSGAEHRATYRGLYQGNQIFIKIPTQYDPNEHFWLLLLDRLKLGPKFYGLIDDRGQLGYLMEEVEGENMKSDQSGFTQNLSPEAQERARAQLLSIKQKFITWGIPVSYLADLQPMIAPNGDIKIIDPRFFPTFRGVDDKDRIDWRIIGELSGSNSMHIDSYIRGLEFCISGLRTLGHSTRDSSVRP